MIINPTIIPCLQKDDPIDLASDHLHEEQFTDEHGNVVSKVGHLVSFRYIEISNRYIYLAHHFEIIISYDG